MDAFWKSDDQQMPLETVHVGASIHHFSSRAFCVFVLSPNQRVCLAWLWTAVFFLLENKKGDRLLAAYSIYHKNILLCSRG
jgi:hypothetical protein